VNKQQILCELNTTIQFMSFMYLIINHTWCTYICIICYCLLCCN